MWCDTCNPTHSSELRRASWLTFDAAFGVGWPTCTPGADRALVSLASASIAESPENNRCVSAPHDDMHRRRRESHGWRGLLRSGRVVGSREDGGSSAATGLVRLRVQTWVDLQVIWPPLRMAKRSSKRATRGGERKSTEVPGHRIRAPRPGRSVRPVWTRRACSFLALAGPAVRRLGDSAPRWPAGSPAQWQRPRMWICVGPRDPTTKPSRGCLRVVELSAIPQLPTYTYIKSTRGGSYYEKNVSFFPAVPQPAAARRSPP